MYSSLQKGQGVRIPAAESALGLVRRRIACAALTFALALLAGFAPGTAAAQSVRVTTNMGEFVIELEPDRAPLTVANFLRYVKEGFYTSTLFHRVVTNFVIQGGGHAATGDYKLKPTHPDVVNESGNGLLNTRGSVGLARSGSPHSGNAQFYVNLQDNPELNPLPTRWGYTVFGHVTQGMDVIDRIGVTATGRMGPFQSEAPLQPVIIEKIELINPAASGAPASGVPATSPATPPATPPAAPKDTPPADPSGAETPAPQ